MFNLQATFLLAFLLNFANGLVAQESKLCSGESKTSKILTIQGQTRIAKCKSAHNSLIIGPRGLRYETNLLEIMA